MRSYDQKRLARAWQGDDTDGADPQRNSLEQISNAKLGNGSAKRREQMCSNGTVKARFDVLSKGMEQQGKAENGEGLAQLAKTRIGEQRQRKVLQGGGPP